MRGYADVQVIEKNKFDPPTGGRNKNKTLRNVNI